MCAAAEKSDAGIGPMPLRPDISGLVSTEDAAASPTTAATALLLSMPALGWWGRGKLMLDILMGMWC